MPWAVPPMRCAAGCGLTAMQTHTHAHAHTRLPRGRRTLRARARGVHGCMAAERTNEGRPPALARASEGRPPVPVRAAGSGYGTHTTPSGQARLRRVQAGRQGQAGCPMPRCVVLPTSEPPQTFY